MPENTNEDKLDIEIKPEIYSSKAVLWFSFLITPVFGGVLLMMNLKRIDKPKEAARAFIISLLMTAFLMFGLTYFDIENRLVQFIYNLLCSFFLAGYLYKKQIPHWDEYPKRSVLVPVLVAVALIIALFFLVLWAQDQIPDQDL
jgi:membrane protein CcdC involved in cytochrome C biogenesis